MRKTALVIGAAASIGLAGTVSAAAHPDAHVPSKAQNPHAKVSPSKPKPGTITTTTAKGLKNTDYYCILTLNKKGLNLRKASAKVADVGSILVVHSSASGAIKCQQVFQKFTKKYHGKHSCPPTRADKRAGWGCGVGLADKNSRGKKSVGVAMFKF